VPLWILAFLGETKGISAKRGGDLRSRPVPWKDVSLVVSRSATLPPRPGNAWNHPVALYFLKTEGGKEFWIISNFVGRLDPSPCCPAKKAGAEAKKGREIPSPAPLASFPQTEAEAK